MGAETRANEFLFRPHLLGCYDQGFGGIASEFIPDAERHKFLHFHGWGSAWPSGPARRSAILNGRFSPLGWRAAIFLDGKMGRLSVKML
jgi:hypothetical protein